MENMQKIGCKGTIHVVERGDTLYKIAIKYGVTVSDIMKSNPYVNVYNLQPQEELCIPVKEPVTIEGVRPYVVTRQDNLASILKNSGTTFEELVKYNRILGQLKLPAGTVIFIPTKIQPRGDENLTNQAVYGQFTKS